MKTQRFSKPKAFTLVELLVAMAITTVIITVLVYVTSMSLDTWNRSRAEIRASRQGKAMLQIMSRDLESFVSRTNNEYQWLAATVPADLPGKPGGNLSTNALDLVFLTAPTDSYDGVLGDGNIAAVGYKLSYQNAINGTQNDDFSTFALYRDVRNPEDVFDNILGQIDLGAAFQGINTTSSNFICENIYQFTLTFHVELETATGIQTYLIPVNGTNGEFFVNGNGLVAATPPAGLTPDDLLKSRVTAAEISVTVLSDFGVQQLRQRATLTQAQLSEFLAKNSYQYSKLVRLPSP